MPISRSVAGLLALMFATAISGPAVAQLPPIRIVIPFAAGGISNSMARIVAKKLGEEVGQTVIVDPQPGASGLVAARRVINAPPDGHTLFLTSPTVMMILPHTTKLEFDPIAKFKPVSNIGSSPLLLAVRSSLPANTLDEFVRHAKSLKPGTLSLASGGAGTSTHLVPELFFKRAGIELTHVPYRGGGPALQDLVAGHVDSYFGNPAEIVGQTGGRIRILATSGATRLKSLPEVQTLSDSYPGLSLVTWNGLVYVDGTPQEMIQKVSRAIQRGSQDAEYVKALTNIGVDVIGDTPEHFDASIRASLPLWKEAIDAAGIKPQ